MGLPASCVDTNHQPTPYVAPNVANTFGTVLGSACFPSVNDAAWMMLNPDYDPVNHPSRPKYIPLAGALFGGEFQPDGKPDTYNDPKREYQAVEIEVNKGFSHNWALVANWRIARLRGNYEGAFRNDNGQADPGISSLFDLRSEERRVGKECRDRWATEHEEKNIELKVDKTVRDDDFRDD